MLQVFQKISLGFILFLTLAIFSLSSGLNLSTALAQTGDAEAPSTPLNLSANPFSSTQINLFWSTSSDTGGSGLTGYKIFRNLLQIATTLQNNYSDTGLQSSTSYTYTVAAYDGAGNTSLQSVSVTATTLNVPSLGLVSAYSFDEGLGIVVNDTSGNNNVGVIGGAAWVNGKYGKALSFDGIDDLVTLPNKSPPARITISAWINPINGGENNQGHIIGMTRGTNPDIILRHSSSNGTTVRFHTGFNTGDFFWNTNGFVTSTWQHIALTYDSVLKGTPKVYINGVLKTTTGTGPALTANLFTSSTVWTIGNNVGKSRTFRGLIDEVRVYNRVLTQSEIQTDMNSPISGGTPPPPPVDTTIPSIPMNLSATPISSYQIDLSWSSSTDTGGNLAGYKVYNGGFQIGITSERSYSSTNLQASTNYTYTVLAYDMAGNVSSQSSSVLAITFPPPDTNPPNILSVSSSLITTSSVLISWITDESSDSQIEYGLASSYGSLTPLNDSLTTNHLITLSDLLPDTTYHYRVGSKDAALNITVSGDNVFTTLPLPPPPGDTTPPLITNVSVIQISSDGGTITWNTNESATSQVEYGPTLSYGSSTLLDSALVTSHSVSFSGLTRNLNYYYRVKSADMANNLSVSPDLNFTTASRMPKPPKVSNLQAQSGSIVLSWTNPQYEYLNGIFILRYPWAYLINYDPAYLISSLSSSIENYTDANVSPGTSYYYSVFTRDDLGNYSDPEYVNFIAINPPSATPLPPPPPSPTPSSPSLSSGGGGSYTLLPVSAPSPTPNPPSTSSPITEKPVQIPPKSLFSSLPQKSFEKVSAPPQVQAQTLFTRTLKRGGRGEDVRLLQQKLQQLGFLPRSLVATNYFGPGTENALKAFQVKHGLISSGTSDTTGFGTLGPKTRAKFNEVLKTNVPQITSAPNPQTSPLVFPSSTTPENVSSIPIRLKGIQDQLQKLLNQIIQ